MPQGSLTTVRQAFEIVEVLWELDGAGPTAVAARQGIPDSTAFEYLRALSETPFVTRENGTYRLSSYFLTMGGKIRYRSQLYQVAKDEMRRVARETDELVGLTIEDAGLAVILHQEEGERALNLGTYVGAATPLHTNAAGKVILAELPDDRREELITSELEPRTDHTVTDTRALRATLATINDQGYGVDWDEQVVGMGMTAVPITVDGGVLGSVCIVAPTDRVKDQSYQQQLVRQLREAKQTVEINYQYGR